MRTGTSLRRVVALALGIGFASGCAAEKLVVTIQTGEPPALIAFRDEGAPEWQLLPVDGASTFEIAPADAYELVVVCVITGGAAMVNSSMYARTSEDAPTFEARCGSSRPYVARGQMAQPSLVALGNFGVSSNGTNWDFSLPAAPGTFDLVVLSRGADTYDGIAFRRDVAIGGDTELGTIDLANEDVHPLVPTLFSATNLLVDDMLFVDAVLAAGGTFVPLRPPGIDPDGESVLLAPNSALRATDRQSVGVTAVAADSTSTRSRSRLLRRDVRVGDQTSVKLPEPLGPVTFETSPERLVATWSGLPDHDRIVVSRRTFSSGMGGPGQSQSRSHQLVVTRSFIETTGITTAALDFRDVPGFQSEWQTDAAGAQFRSFLAVHQPSDTEMASSAETEVIPAPQAALGSPVHLDARDPHLTTRWSMPGERVP
jgi:hypothetical protein